MIRYVVITPVRNEQENLAFTVNTMIRQKLLPQQWIIINDGSTDTTGRIADGAAQDHKWIKVIHRQDRGFRRSGGGVIEAFYDGFATLPEDSWDYLVKLDGDLSFDPDYFSLCFEEFNKDTKLGIGGGTVCITVDGQLVEESKGDPPFHVRGATKIYRNQCWVEIGGLLRETGWDTLDEVKANMLGWKTKTFESLKVIHHRRTGKADGSWKNWVKNGKANYIVGYHPLFMAVKCFRRLFEPPYGLMSVGLMFGYLSGYMNRSPQVNDPSLISYLRSQQLRRLTFKSSLWDPQ